MAYPKTSAKVAFTSGTMGVTVGLLVLFVLGASLSCDARELIITGLSSKETTASDVSVLQINHQESEGEVKASEEVVRIGNMCTMCEEFVTEALEYLKENKTQTEIIDILHNTCSRLLTFEEQCISLVDYYAPLFFLEIGLVQPGDFCESVNLCSQRVIVSLPLSKGKCEICHQAVAKVLLKLKDPETQLDIIEMLLKACTAVESHVRKCKTMVFEYGPLIFANAEQYLETTDMCTAIHACDSPSADSHQALPIEKKSLLSVL